MQKRKISIQDNRIRSRRIALCIILILALGTLLLLKMMLHDIEDYPFNMTATTIVATNDTMVFYPVYLTNDALAQQTMIRTPLP